MANRPLTTRQKKFIEVYNGNGVEAARLAGYSGNDAVLSITAHTMLRNPKIKDPIDARMKSEIAPQKNYRIMLQTFWEEMMHDPEADRRDRLKASELLGKSQAMFIDRHEHTGKISLEDFVAGSHDGEK